MICPKCGFEQPESPECLRCGVIISRYRGAPAGATPPTPAQPFAVPPPLPPQTARSPQLPQSSQSPPPLPTGHETVRLALDPPAAPPLAPATFASPAPSPAGATVYQGPDAGTPAAEAMRQAPSFGSLQSSLRMASRRLAVGEVLSETFAIYSSNIIPFLILTAFAYAPVLVLGGFAGEAGKSHGMTAITTAVLVALAAMLLSMPLSTAAITYGVFQQMRGKDASLGSCLSVGLSCLFPVLSVVGLQVLVILGLVMVAMIPMFFVAKMPGCSILMIPLMLACLLGFLLLVLRFYVAVPAAVEERPGAVGALGRSSYLTEGERGKIFGVVFVLGLISSVLTRAVASIPRAGVVLQPVVSLITIGLSATACAVIYYRLRSLKESIDVDQIASVFA